MRVREHVACTLEIPSAERNGRYVTLRGKSNGSLRLAFPPVRERHYRAHADITPTISWAIERMISR
jgi:hypothetical protein